MEKFEDEVQGSYFKMLYEKRCVAATLLHVQPYTALFIHLSQAIFI